MLTRSTPIARQPPSDPPPTRRKAPRKPAAAPLAGLAPAQGTPRKKATVAGPGKSPRAKRAPKPPEPSELDRLQTVIVGSLEDDKAEAITTLDLAGRAAFCDRMVIATGLADRQISAMATHLEDRLAEIGLKRVQIEGLGSSDWVLIDAGDIVIHLFKPEARAAYGLERMWSPGLDDAEADDEAAEPRQA